MVTITAVTNVLFQVVKFLYVKYKLEINYPLYSYDFKIIKEIIIYASPIL